jgi:Cytochrome c554 and c-prime
MSHPTPSPPAGLARLLVVAALVGAGVVWAVSSWPKPAPSPPVEPEPVFPLTPVASSPYLNTGPEAHYVGSETCRSCHPDRHESFRRTGMGRSMATVDLAREPADAVYDYAPSKRCYQVARKDGQLWHRELLLDVSPEVVLSEYPLKYVVGSGRHSLTYLCEVDGFLVESPATWYTSRKDWDMSPGYKGPDQIGFERAVGEGCLNCHAGRAEAVGGSLHKMKVIEAAIGCERCHGPGSLHAERHRDRGRPAPVRREADLTIVNPARLPRDLAESICQQCHLRPTAVVVARGRSASEFRPGLPLSDFLHAYQVESENSSMTVVGHVEQMHLSRCYQRSDRLTCLTCHDPHGEPRAEERVDYYRSACQGCHQPEHCKVSDARRKKESPENDCVQCHMPRSPTEIPHLAFTHHRIAVHDRAPAAGGSGRAGGAEIVPFADLFRFSDTDRKRSAGLGYLEAANRERDTRRADYHRGRAFELLDGVRSAGLRDPFADTALARLRFDTRMGEVLPLADGALARPELVGQERCNALFLRADALAADGRNEEAAATLRELTALRRHSVDWLLLADCERALGRPDAWAEALVRAARINPRLWKVHQALADHYQRKGDAEKAAWHRRRAVP